ncbi:MAG TPA: FtsW/RodA/SpoVE family cell cycle protein, partial [Dehalococcoidia bacterium]
MTTGYRRVTAGKPDFAILVTALTLVVIGLIFVYSASFAIALAEFGDVNYFLFRQTAAALMGLCALCICAGTDYHKLRALSPLFMLVAVVSLGAVLFLGNDVYGARRWISLGALPPFPPSEFATLALIIYISAWLASNKRDLRSFAVGFMPFIFAVGLVAALIIL